MTRGADRIAERHEELDQNAIWIRFGMRFDCSDRLAGQPVISRLVHLGPSRGCELRKKRSVASLLLSLCRARAIGRCPCLRCRFAALLFPNIEPIQKELENGYLLHPSPRFTQLLTGS